MDSDGFSVFHDSDHFGRWSDRELERDFCVAIESSRSIDNSWIKGRSSLWVLCVEYMDGANGADLVREARGVARTKTDYKEILSESDFAVFAKLREVRKAIAQSEAVPVYTIFTNEQLAQMVSSKATTRAALARIDGLGDARLDKYGKRMLDVLSTAWKEEPVAHEAGGKPV